MRRIKHARTAFYSLKAGTPGFELPEVIESNDLYKLLAVARAAEALVKDFESGQKVMGELQYASPMIFDLRNTLDKLNTPAGGGKK